MKSYQEQYKRILENLIDNPDKIVDTRVGKARSRFVENIRVDLRKEFPLMDIKKLSFNNIKHELFWFLNGSTNIKYLVENGCNIWNDDAYRYYKEKFSPFRFEKDKYKSNQYALDFFKNNKEITKEEFIERVKRGERLVDQFLEQTDHGLVLPDSFAWLDGNYVYGDLDKIYGYQWRSFGGIVDQLSIAIEALKTKPDDRQKVVITAHNPKDIYMGEVGLPSCHNYMQFYTTPLTEDEKTSYGFSKYENPRFLSVYYNIRSNDFFLGQPYNTPSYALLLHMVANSIGMIPKEVVCNAVDCHLYEAHIDAAKEWLRRYNDLFDEEENIDEVKETAFTLCKSQLRLKNSDNIKNIDDIKADDLQIINYNSQKRINAPLLT